MAFLSIHPERIGAAWEEALASDRPVILEMKTDPNVPPLPPHITLDEAASFTSTLAEGRARRGQRAAWNRARRCWLRAPRTSFLRC